MNPVLAFDAVTYSYPQADHPALDDLSLTLIPGETTAILGPNGAGKTTLLRLAYGRLHPASGQIVLQGAPLAQYTHRQIGQRVGLVPQREYNPFEYSLLEYALLGRAPHLHPLELPGATDCQIAQTALERVGLADRAHQSIHTLSGGEHQLLLIARALAQQPALLLLDEPTAHLDLSNKQLLVRQLRSLAAEGVTILLTTHDPDVAAALAAQLILMRSGRVLRAGPLTEVWNDDDLSTAYGISLRTRQLDGKRLLQWDD
ncbi:MAG TPA: ABC transporter ATP-binding protein [Anaerolineaceae bacterium]|nr:ABC transporter ATP-binding protein [Anaerolineaceae bacterium]